jgi:hypothetical protein
MWLTKTYDFTWKVRAGGVKPFEIRASSRRMVTESFCLLHISAGAVQRIKKGEAECRESEDGRIWYCTDVKCSDDGNGLVGLAFRMESRAADAVSPTSSSWSQATEPSMLCLQSVRSVAPSNGSLSAISGLRLSDLSSVPASTLQLAGVSVDSLKEPSQSAKSGQGTSHCFPAP